MLQDSKTNHILFVAHGSRSSRWVSVQQNWWLGVNRKLRKAFGKQVTSELSFLEISPPLFENRLKTWAEKKPSRELFVFPFFLSQSGHAGEEIPEIIEEQYPEAAFIKVSSEDWASVLANNIERRLQNYGADEKTPVIISGYGSSKHNHNWRKLLKDIQNASSIYRDKPKWSFAPAGHFLNDYHAPLHCQINSLKKQGYKSCAIVPLYLSISSYQEKLIPGIIKVHPEMTFHTGCDAVLPDDSIEQWAVDRIDSAIFNT